jgi:hypothetical protein
MKFNINSKFLKDLIKNKSGDKIKFNVHTNKQFKKLVHSWGNGQRNIVKKLVQVARNAYPEGKIKKDAIKLKLDLMKPDSYFSYRKEKSGNVSKDSSEIHPKIKKIKIESANARLNRIESFLHHVNRTDNQKFSLLTSTYVNSEGEKDLDPNNIMK